MAVKFGLACAGIAMALVLPEAAFASHGKAGLWEATTTIDANMPAIPPEALAQMKAHGIKPPSGQGHSFTTQFCMSQADVDSDKPPAMKDNLCKVTNMKTAAQSYSADLVCSGDLQGTSHFMVSYDTPEHYKGQSEFSGTAGGQPMHNVTKFEGHWLKADCGAVKPYVPGK